MEFVTHTLQFRTETNNALLKTKINKQINNKVYNLTPSCYDLHDVPDSFLPELLPSVARSFQTPILECLS